MKKRQSITTISDEKEGQAPENPPEIITYDPIPNRPSSSYLRREGSQEFETTPAFLEEYQSQRAVDEGQEGGDSPVNGHRSASPGPGEADDDFDAEATQFAEDDQEAGSDDSLDLFPEPQAEVSTVSQPLKEHVVGGIISTFRNKNQREKALERRAARKYVLDCQADVLRQQQVVSDAQSRAAQADEHCQQLEHNVALLEQGIRNLQAGGSSAALVRRNEITNLRQRLHSCKALLEEQRVVVTRALSEYDTSEHDMGMAEATLHKAMSLHEQLEDIERNEVRENNVLAEYRAQKETEAAVRFEKRRKKREAQLEQLEMEVQAKNEEQMAAARAGVQNAKKYLAHSHADVASRKNDVQQKQQAEIERRTKAILELKNSTEEARNKMRSINEARAKKQAVLAKEMEEEKAALLAQGLNPFAVFRHREQQKNLEKDAKRKAAIQKEREAELLRRLDKEAIRRKAKKAHDLEEKAMQTAFQEEMGVAAKEKRLRNYMTTKTTEGVEILDPTGHTTIYPSKVTLVKDWKFGLGNASMAQIDLVQARHRDVTADPAFLPQTPRSARPIKREKKKKKSLEDEGPPKTALPEPDENKLGPQEVFAQPEFQGLWVAEPPKKAERWRPNLSVLEQRRLEEGKARQKENIFKKQVVWGQEFQGRAFLPKPETILFKDFEVGKVYHLKVVLTNVSYTFNTFKVMELADNVKDFFNIKYTHPGAMSAGMTCDLHITFSPQVNEDINSELPLLGETGPFSIPIQCLRKKVLVSFPSEVLELDVVMGESVTRSIKIVNGGAIPPQFEIIEDYTRSDGPTPVGNEPYEPYVPCAQEVTYSATGEATPYATTRVPVTFTPTRPGFFEIPLVFSFTPDDYRRRPKPAYEDEFGQKHAYPRPPPFVVIVRCRASQVPLFVQRETIDFLCCAFGKVYRDTLVVCNRGKVALKAQPKICTELRGFMEFLPNMGYVQAGETFAFQIKFTPTQSILKSCAKFLRSDANSHHILIPVRVEVPDQALPVFFVFKVQLTLLVLNLHSKSLDFGVVPLGETAIAPLTIANDSALPQKVGFIRPPKEVAVQPNDGFCTLLPMERRVFDVHFSPLSSVDYRFSLVVKDILNQEYSVLCTAKGVAAPLQFSSSCVEMSATALGDTSEACVYVTNTTKADIMFEVEVPEESSLKVIPFVVALKAQTKAPLRVVFAPKPDAETPWTGARPPPIGIVLDGDQLPRSARPGTTSDADEAIALGSEDVPASATPGRASGTPKTRATPTPHEEVTRNAAGTPKSAKGVRETSTTPAPESGGDAPAAPDTQQRIWKGPNRATYDTDGTVHLEPWSRHNLWGLPVAIKGVDSFKQYMQVSTITTLPLLRADNYVPPPEEPAAQADPEPEAAAAAVAAAAPPAKGKEPKKDKAAEAAAAKAAAQKEAEEKAAADAIKAAAEALAASGGLPDLTLDFGQVPVGHEVIKTVSIRNMEDVRTTLRIEPLDPLGAFVMLGVPRPMDPGETQQLTISFRPLHEYKFKESLVVVSDRNRLTYQLAGHGVSPTYTIDLSDDDLVDLGDVLVGETSERVFNLANTSAFPLSYTVVITQTGHFNKSHMVAFDAVPCEGTLESGQSWPIKLSFAPDNPSLHFSAQLKVDVPNQDKQRIYTLKARSWLYAMYVMGGDDREPLVDNFRLPACDDPVQGRTLTLTFREMTLEVGQSASRTIEVGNAATKKDIGEFVFELPPEAKNLGFSLDPASGTVEPQKRRAITFKFTPPADKAALGQWNEVNVKGTLRKGVPALPDGYRFTVKLRGYAAGELERGGTIDITNSKSSNAG